jgi:hypothetical protein
MGTKEFLRKNYIPNRTSTSIANILRTVAPGRWVGGIVTPLNDRREVGSVPEED